MPSEVHALVTEVRLSVLPFDLDDPERHLWDVLVSWRGGDRYAVCSHGGIFCLGYDGEWEIEPIPSSRTKAWLDGHRFDYQTAQQLAAKHAPTVEVNRITALQKLAGLAGEADR